MGEMKSSYEKKKSQLLRFNMGGGGGVVLGGVVLLGGGLAVAGLVAVFSIIKNRNSGKDYNKQEDATPYEGSQGLNFVLQDPSTPVHQNSCCTSHGTTTIGRTGSLMDSKELVSAHNMPLGDKTLPIMDRETEVLSSDALKKEIHESANDILNKEETSLPVPIKMIKNDSNKNLQPTENIEVKREEEPAENLPMQSVKDEEQEQGENDDDDGSEERVVENEEDIGEPELALKENSPVQSVDEEEEEDDDDNNNDSGEEDDSEDVTGKEEESSEGTRDSNNDSGEEDDSEYVAEKEEESSEGTGSSFLESNVEAIWPTEVIEALSRELKEINTSNQNSGEKKIAKPEPHDYLTRKSDASMFNEYGNNSETKKSAMLNEKTTQELGMVKVENVNLPKREVFVWSLLLLVILLLLLLLIHYCTVSVHDLSYQSSVVGPQV